MFKKTVEITSAPVTQFIVETTGYKQGDAGHGCKTTITIRNLGSFASKVQVTELGTKFAFEDFSELSFTFFGGCEYKTVLQGLKEVVAELELRKNNADEIYDTQTDVITER